MALPLEKTSFPVMLTVAAGLLVSLVLGSLSFAWEQQRWQAGVQNAAAERLYGLRGELDHELRAARHLGALFRSSERIGEAQFQAYVAEAQIASPASDGVAWYDYVAAQARRAYERRHGVIIREYDGGQRVPAATRSHYFPLRYGVLPDHKPDLTAFSPTAPGPRREALLQALTSRHAAVTAPINLLSEAEDRDGIVIYHPVFAADAAERPLGIAAIAHRTSQLLGRTGPTSAQSPLLQVFDVTDGERQPLYDEASAAAKLADEPVAEQEFEFGGRRWLARLQAPAMPFPLPALLAVLSTLLLTGVLAAYLYAQLRQREAVERQVELRTRDLSATNQALERTLQDKERAIANLAESEARYRLLADNASDIIARTDPDGVLLYVSPACQRLLGFSPEEMIGRKTYDFHHPSDIYRIRQAHEKALAEPGIYSVNYRMRHAEGHYVWMAATHRFLSDARGTVTGIISVFRNISEQKAAERALRESETLFRSAFEDAAEGMVLFDPQRRFVRVNQAFCLMTGYSRDEMRNLRVDDLTHPADQDVTPGAVEQLLSGEVQRIRLEKRYLHKDGHTIWLAAQLSLVRDHQGQPLYFISQSQDITERKATEHALEALRRRQELILDTTTEGIYGLDAEGRASFVNRAAVELLGYAREELLGQELHQLVHSRHPDGSAYPIEDCPIWQCLRDQVSRHVEQDAFWHRDGRALPVRYTCSAMTEGERVHGVVVVFNLREAAPAAQDASLALATAVDLDAEGG